MGVLLLLHTFPMSFHQSGLSKCAADASVLHGGIMRSCSALQSSHWVYSFSFSVHILQSGRFSSGGSKTQRCESAPGLDKYAEPCRLTLHEIHKLLVFWRSLHC